MMKKLISILTIACMVLTMLPLQAFAGTPTYVEVRKFDAAIRCGKGEKYAIVARASKGTVLEVVDSGLNIYLNRWYKVRLNTTDGIKSGWIFEDNVKKVSTSGSGYTTAIKMSKTDVSLNLRGTKTATLSAVMKYKNRTEGNSYLVYSSSDDSVATVDSNGKVTAKGVGVATIKVTHKLFSTTATATIKVTEQVTLDVQAKEQSNSSCCSGAAAAAVLKYLNGSSKTDLQLYKEMGSSGVVYKIVNVLNKYLGNVYKYGTYNTQTKFVNALKASINAGYPAIALVKITTNAYFKYTSNGHFTVVSGYRVNTDGSVDVRVTDSYKITKNSGTFWVPAKTFFNYSKSHGNPYFFIVRK